MPACAQSRPATEYEVKALFLSEFSRFVEWNGSQAGSPDFAICVLGVDPFGLSLDEAVKGKAASGAAVVAQRILAVRDAASCRIVFISPSEDGRLTDVLKALEGMSVLTVGEGSQFTRRGGMIAFRVEGSRVRITVNLAAAERQGLKLSSHLLKLARIEGEGSSGL
jgi:hypothetical protein